MAARAFGSGTVSFGLVSIPIKIYTTNKSDNSIRFNMLHDACGTKLKQQYICPKDNEVVPRDKMAKGYEYEKGKFVKLTSDEIKALEAVSDNTVSLQEFVPVEAIDSLYIDKSYYLGPDKGGDRAYALLCQAMRATGLVGVARYSARGKQHVVMVRPFGESGIIMHQMRYQADVRSFEDVPIGDVPALAQAELDLAIKIVEQISADEFRPEDYSDEVKSRVLALIQQKVDGEEIEVAAPVAKGEIIDLMAALKASLGMADSEARKPAKATEEKASKKKTTGRKKKKAAEG